MHNPKQAGDGYDALRNAGLGSYTNLKMNDGSGVPKPNTAALTGGLKGMFSMMGKGPSMYASGLADASTSPPGKMD